MRRSASLKAKLAKKTVSAAMESDALETSVSLRKEMEHPVWIPKAARHLWFATPKVTVETLE